MRLFDQMTACSIWIIQSGTGAVTHLLQKLDGIGLAEMVTSRQEKVIGAAVLAACVSVALFLKPQDRPNVQAETLRAAKIDRAISGCYIKGEDGERIVYAGIVTPGLEEFEGRLALERNKKLVVGRTVRLRFGQKQEDKDGRFVSFVFADGVMINEQLVAEGLAYVRLREGEDRFAEELLLAQEEARAARRGIWKRKRQSTESRYPADRKYAAFHRPDCEDVSKIKDGRAVDFKTPDDAFLQGFAPCGHCRPW